MRNLALSVNAIGLANANTPSRQAALYAVGDASASGTTVLVVAGAQTLSLLAYRIMIGAATLAALGRLNATVMNGATSWFRQYAILDVVPTLVPFDTPWIKLAERRPLTAGASLGLNLSAALTGGFVRLEAQYVIE